jgi:hypothetical protein
MKSSTTKKYRARQPKTSIIQVVYGHIPGLKIERKTTNQDTNSVDLIRAVYRHVFGQQS